jgi:hypothetical protein
MNKRLKIALRALPALIIGGALFFAAVRPTVVEATVPGTNTMLSVKTDGSQAGGVNNNPSMSKDGKIVAFTSSANLVSADTNSRSDIYVRDTVANTINRISVSSSGVQQTSGGSRAPHVSASGRYVVFNSSSFNLIDGQTLPTTGLWHIYVHDLQTHTTEMIDVDSSGQPGNSQAGYFGGQEISEDGRFVVFESNSTNLVSGVTTNSTRIYVKDRLLNTMTLISKSTAGSPSYGEKPSMSCDGAFIAYHSGASDITSGDTNGKQDIFLVQRIGGDYTTNITQSSNQASNVPKVSCNGNFVTLTTAASLESSDTDTQYDNYVYDRLENSFDRVNVNGSDAAANAQSVSTNPSFVTDDGRFVAFFSATTNLDSIATSGIQQLYLRDRLNGTTELVSKNVTPTAGDTKSGSTTTMQANEVVLDQLGKKVVYTSDATNLGPTDINGQSDIFSAPTGY